MICFFSLSYFYERNIIVQIKKLQNYCFIQPLFSKYWRSETTARDVYSKEFSFSWADPKRAFVLRGRVYGVEFLSRYPSTHRYLTVISSEFSGGDVSKARGGEEWSQCTPVDKHV